MVCNQCQKEVGIKCAIKGAATAEDAHLEGAFRREGARSEGEGAFRREGARSEGEGAFRREGA